MIVLDTNVISEPLKPFPEQNVLAWLNEQTAETLFITAISLAELRHGVAAMPRGRRRNRLASALEDQVLSLFGPRVLAFDAAAASAYAEIRVRTDSAGRPISAADSYIAATAAAHGFAIATREDAAFEAAGIQVINPWHFTD